MEYEYKLIHMRNDLTVGDRLYSLILLRARSLSITLSGVRCWLDGKYLLCMSGEDAITFHSGQYEVNNRYIRENIGQKLTLTGLCEHFHTNRTTLTRKIKELTGLSP